MAAESSSRHPDRVGRYEVLLPIASGGMATVYLARSVGVAGFEREVALKLTHSHLRENREFAFDLIEEAKLAVRIRHPNVVSVLDAGEDSHGLFLVMDYVEGDTLAALQSQAASRGDGLSWRVGLRLLLDALAGLQAAHDLRGVDGRAVSLVHRDFSPQNVLAGIDGIGRLTDFGIAKAVTRLGHTSTGVIKGKLGYMSPEQARGLPLDRRCDVWAAGVVAWELFAGTRLFSGEEAAMLLKIVSETPAPLRSVVADVPPEIERAVARALEPDRNRRWPTASAFARALLAAAQPLGLVGEPEEVAEAVQELVADKLERRRMQVRQLIEHRKQPAGSQTSEPAETEAAPAAQQPVSEHASSSAAQDAPAGSVVSKTSAAVQPFWLGVAGLVAAGLVVGLILSRTGSQSPSPAAPVPLIASSTASSPPPSASALQPAAPSVEFLSIDSDVALRSVKVEGKTIPLATPSRTLGIQVSIEELGRGVAVEAVAIDGRSLRVIGESGQHTVTMRFQGGRSASGSASGPARLPFAPNPYGARQP